MPPVAKAASKCPSKAASPQPAQSSVPVGEAERQTSFAEEMLTVMKDQTESMDTMCGAMRILTGRVTDLVEYGRRESARAGPIH